MLYIPSCYSDVIIVFYESKVCIYMRILKLIAFERSLLQLYISFVVFFCNFLLDRMTPLLYVCMTPLTLSSSKTG